MTSPAGVESQNYTITGSATNQYNLVGYATAIITVNKAGPQFTAADLSVSPAIAQEGETINLIGQFTDLDTLSSHTVTIDWGDDSTPTVLGELEGQVVQSATPGLFTYSTTHQYLSNPPGELTGGSYAINVSVSDGVNTTSAGTSIVVNNTAPTVRIESAGNEGSTTIELTALVTDRDPLATDTVAWTLTQGGTVTQTGTGSSFSFTNPGGVLDWTVTATVTSSDGAVGSDSSQIVVINPSGATVTINALTITIAVPGNPSTSAFVGSADRLIALVYGSNDLVDATAFPDPVELDGYGGDETLLAGSADDLLVGGPGANSLVGGAGDDTLVSNAGDDTLVGGTGSAVFQINPGPDPLVIGAGGSNTLDFSTATSPITINLGLESGQPQIVDSDNDQVTLDGKFNQYIGSPMGNNVTLNDDGDLVFALAGNNTITAGSGHDSIVGGSGNDLISATTSGNTTITAGSGHDSIVGGSGNDIIYIDLRQRDHHRRIGPRFDRRRIGQ